MVDMMSSWVWKYACAYNDMFDMALSEAKIEQILHEKRELTFGFTHSSGYSENNGTVLEEYDGLIEGFQVHTIFQSAE